MSATLETTDSVAIAQVLQAYVDGAKTGSTATMKPAFHEAATIYGWFDKELFGGPIQILFDWVDANPPVSDLTHRIESIDIQGTAATARLELDNWAGHRFTDFFTLLKSNGAWQILSKAFYLHPEA